MVDHEAILTRNRNIVRTNLGILDQWVGKEPSISYVKLKAATVALLKHDYNIPSHDFCVRLLESQGVMFTPGSALEMKGYVRIGFANNQTVLEQGLERVPSWWISLAESRCNSVVAISPRSYPSSDPCPCCHYELTQSRPAGTLPVPVDEPVSPFFPYVETTITPRGQTIGQFVHLEK